MAADAPREPDLTGPPSGESGFSGSLRESPLFMVLRRIQRDRLSGTLSVFREDQVRQLFFVHGELEAARSSQEDHRIGRTLVRWGYITEQELAHALEIQAHTHERIDKVLVENGLVTRVLIDSEARRQMEQIVFSTLSWPDGAFHFEANTGELELDVEVSLSQEMIIEGIRRIPESEQFTELLGDLSAVPTLTRDPMSSGAFRLLRDAVEVLDQIDGKRSARELLSGAPVSGSASAKILYSLLFAGLIEMRPPANASSPAADAMVADQIGVPDQRSATQQLLEESLKIRRPSQRAIPMPGPDGSVERSPREIVLDTYRQLDWLSHYDLLGVSRKATAREIEDAFRSKSRLFDPSLKAHPELVDCWRQLTVLTKWLKVAHGVLSNPTARAAYDGKIDQATPPGTAPENR